MFVNYKGSTVGILRWQWKLALLFLVSSISVCLIDQFAADVIAYVKLPGLPLAVVGAALGIFVSFRTNSGYDRWWEGRKLWGRLVNVSRHFTTQVLVYLPDDARALQERLVLRHIAYVHTLRCLLRGHPTHEDKELMRALEATGDDVETYKSQTNMTHALLQRQMEELTAAEGLDPLRMQSFDESVRVMLDVQGGCERIKKTPFPFSYGFIASRLIVAYGVLLPLALVEELGWLTVPITLLVCIAFTLISEVGRALEDPFTMFWPALPLSALASTIDVNLRQRLGDEALEPLPKPDAKGILM